MIYLDHNATSPLLPEALDAMKPWLGKPGNPSSAHRAGQAAAMAVDEARIHVAKLVGAKPEGVVFTSGATEANHMFLNGQRAHLIEHDLAYAYSKIEHPCVVSAGERLSQQGVATRLLQVKPDGEICLPNEVESIGVLSIMAANHETGVLQPLAEALQLKRNTPLRVHVDATQAAGRSHLDLGEADGIVISSHKLGGPGGVGALILPDGEPFPSLLTGGSQERGRRAGTVNTAGVVGFGVACQLALERLTHRIQHWSRLREIFTGGLKKMGGNVIGTHTIANTISVTFSGFQSESLVQGMDLRGVCISAGAACSSGSLQASPVLTAMGVADAHSGIRFSMGPSTTEEEVMQTLHLLEDTIRGLREAEELEWSFDV